jgi:hypothetical protein
MISQGSPPDDDDSDGGGNRRPPTTRFVKGQSGNQAGRPPGRWREAPYEAVLGRMVTIREGEIERQVRADEAFLLQHSKRALEGDRAAPRTTLAVIEYAKERLSTLHDTIRTITRVIIAPGSVTYALLPLRMAEKLDAYRETARMALEPWLVEAALARLDRILNPEEQRTIVKATRTPHQVKWPKWWSEYP